MRRAFLIASVLSAGAAFALALDLKPRTLEAYDRYIAETDARMQPRWAGEHFLWFDDSPGLRVRLMAGAVLAQPAKGTGVVGVPGGLIQDWIGAVFIPKVTLEDALRVVQDYPRHAEWYKPDIAAVNVLSHSGGDFFIRTRIVKSKFFITDVLEVDNAIHYVTLDATRVYSRSSSQRIVEISNPGKPNEKELPPGHDRGLMWRITGYWFFQEADGGVYITSESVTLTRDIPFLMGKMLSPILHEFPAEALQTSLEQTRKAIENQPQLTAP